MEQRKRMERKENKNPPIPQFVRLIKTKGFQTLQLCLLQIQQIHSFAFFFTKACNFYINLNPIILTSTSSIIHISSLYTTILTIFPIHNHNLATLNASHMLHQFLVVEIDHQRDPSTTTHSLGKMRRPSKAHPTQLLQDFFIIIWFLMIQFDNKSFRSKAFMVKLYHKKPLFMFQRLVLSFNFMLVWWFLRSMVLLGLVVRLW